MLGLLVAVIHYIEHANESNSQQFTFTFAFFTMRVFVSPVFAIYLCLQTSLLFRAMAPEWQRGTANFVVGFWWSLYWIPLSTYMCVKVIGSENRGQFFADYGASLPTIITMFVSDQLVDIVQRRKVERDLVIHHLSEVVGSMLFLDWLSVDHRDPGILILALMSALDRLAFGLQVLNAFHGQMNILPVIHQEQQAKVPINESLAAEFTPHCAAPKSSDCCRNGCCNDSTKINFAASVHDDEDSEHASTAIIIPAEVGNQNQINDSEITGCNLRKLNRAANELVGDRLVRSVSPTQLCNLYKCLFVFYTVGIRGTLFALISLHIALHNNNDMQLVWKIGLPVIMMFYCILDIDLYRVQWRRGFGRGQYY